MVDFENKFTAFKEFVNELTKTFKYGRNNIALEKVENGEQYTLSKKVNYPFDYQSLKTDVIKFINTEIKEDTNKGVKSFGMTRYGESIEVNFNDEEEIVIITIKDLKESKMNDIEEQYEKARSYLLSIIDNKKNKAMAKTRESLENTRGTRYTLSEDKENPANLEEFHYPSFKEDMIEELGKLMSDVSDTVQRHPSVILGQGMASKTESFDVKYNDEKETIEIIFRQYDPKEKFELVKKNTKTAYDLNNKEVTLYQIRALRDFNCPYKINPDDEILGQTLIKKGELGGYVEKEENLSHEGGCWIFEDAEVLDNARVEGNARLVGRSLVRDNAVVKGYSCLAASAYVWGNAILDGCTVMKGQVSIGGNSTTNGYVSINGNSQVRGDSVLDGYIYLGGTVVVEDAKVTGSVHLCGQYRVSFDIDGNKGVAAYRTTEPIFDQNGYDVERNSFEYVIASTKEDIWTVYDFRGTGDELIQRVEENYPTSTEYYRNLVEYHKKQYNL